MDYPRFIPQKRTALDGRVWYCAFDTERNMFSPYTCHGRYKTKEECQFNIDWYNKRWFNN